MKVQDLKVKVQKAEEAVAKRQATLEKQIQKEAKRREALIAKGVDVNDPKVRFQFAGGVNTDLYWEVCDWEEAVETVKNSQKVLQEKVRALNTWRDRLTEAEKKENLWITQIPESMKAMQAELVERWDVYDLAKKERLIQAKKELGYEGFMRKYSYSDYQFIYTTEEEIHKENERAAEELIINLYHRIHAITGEVTDWEYIHFRGGALNGFVTGKLGKVKVESILAGGYNIQRLHVRVLVHEIK